MEVYFVRHGQTQNNAERRITGHTDIPVSEEGLRDVARALSEIPRTCSHMYIGDLLRHQQTADVLNEELRLPITIDPRIREKSFGSLEGQLWSEADPTGELWRQNAEQTYDYRPYGGESVAEVTARVESFLNDLREKHRDESIVVVSSGGIIRLILKLHAGEVHERLQNASVHRLVFP